ncbi:MAG: TetR/AcrR family transcriptional regulator [Acidimicrobiia bacterium]|nr:TetR/AcrR family transcriptional regulator [Acidimicrobiia bacterium]
MAEPLESDGPRARLFEAAEVHFRRYGFRRATIDDITRDAETGKGSFYLHFDSKEAAYLEVVEASLARFLEAAGEALRREGPVPNRLRALVEITAEHYGHDELLRASLFGAGDLVDGRVSAAAAHMQRSRIRELLAETLEEGIAEGSIRDTVDVEAAAAVLFEIGWAVVRAELEGNIDLPFDVALSTLNEIVGLGVVSREPRP